MTKQIQIKLKLIVFVENELNPKARRYQLEFAIITILRLFQAVCW